ncbi:hypothetical protein [Alloactinosynnema sp. L-07]|nr:hypothetical protein [Alloactinosynnema sp. L-07]
MVPTTGTLELYLTAATYEQLRGLRGIGWRPDEPNTILRVLPSDLPDLAVDTIIGTGLVLVAAAAADLLDHGDDRGTLGARELLTPRTGSHS